MTILVPDAFCPDESDNAKIQSVLMPLCKKSNSDEDTRSVDFDQDDDLSDEETNEWEDKDLLVSRV